MQAGSNTLASQALGELDESIVNGTLAVSQPLSVVITPNQALLSSHSGFTQTDCVVFMTDIPTESRPGNGKNGAWNGMWTINCSTCLQSFIGIAHILTRAACWRYIALPLS